jgi:hypothetical protein
MAMAEDKHAAEQQQYPPPHLSSNSASEKGSDLLETSHKDENESPADATAHDNHGQEQVAPMNGDAVGLGEKSLPAGAGAVPVRFIDERLAFGRR